MSKPIEAYPLSWPDGWKRTPHLSRRRAHFNRKERKYRESAIAGQPASSWLQTKDITVADGVGRILRELEAMGVQQGDVIISTNVPTRLNGMPRAGQREPDDPGAAVYWRKPNQDMRAMAIDRYDRVADNLAAIGATLEAMRAIERHGGAEILDRTFRGFKALPDKATEPWRDVLNIGHEARVTTDDVDRRFAELVKKHHPDMGGDAAEFQRIVEARNQARKELMATH
jgi:hypothetical protein